MERLTDGNWDVLVTQGSEVDVWVVIVFGPLSYIGTMLIGLMGIGTDQRAMR